MSESIDKRRKRVKKLLERILSFFSIQAHVQLTFKHSGGDLGTSFCSPPYRTASINIDIEHMQHMDEEQLVDTCVHEVLHYITQPLYTNANRLAKAESKFAQRVIRDNNEELVTTLAAALTPIFMKEKK